MQNKKYYNFFGGGEGNSREGDTWTSSDIQWEVEGEDM
jgi:hypothetical protein